MKAVMAILWILSGLAFLGGAIYLAMNDVKGWGWLIFVSVLILGSITIKDGKFKV